ncbi:ArnT family glycosyltransferase [Dyella soli]|uniref:Glycosyltransferase family 39 protein n=1 Tax=Dyella soli TaxID=522319 RepID=A0A4R0YJY1_9GAMM|nr:glycosyltransferase family 39 protein [Dyella soli]TCI08819.1 glycosyltransferase family 39 protein [Dyella soli]
MTQGGETPDLLPPTTVDAFPAQAPAAEPAADGQRNVSSSAQLAPTLRRERLERWLLLLGALLLLGLGIGLRGPTPSDEPRFALVAHQMVASGNWLIPHRGADWYSDKPPTFMAMQALSYVLSGHWWVAFLLPSLLCSLGTLWLVYDLARRLWGHRVGLWAGLALLCTVQFVFQARRGQIDPTVTFFVTLANYGLLRHFLLGPDWRAFWLGCFAAGLGVITKGIGVLAFLLLLPWLLARRQQWRHLSAIEWRALPWLGGVAAFVAAIALWLVPLLFYVQAHDSVTARNYLNDIFFNQTVHRYVHPWNSFQPPWFYLEVIFTSWLPLSLALPGLLPAWRRSLRERDARFLLPLAWAVLVIVFFSLTRAKRDVYIMPALPLLVLAAAPFLEGIMQRRWAQWTAIGFVLVLGLASLGIGANALLLHSASAARFAAARQLGDQAPRLWWMFVAMGAWLVLSVLVFRRRRAAAALLAGLSGVWLVWGLAAAPLLARASSPAPLVARVEQAIGPDAQLALVAWKEELPLAFERKVTDFGFMTPWHSQLSESIRWQQQGPADRWVLILADVMAPCIDRAATLDMGVTSGRDWRLYRLDAVAPACRDGNVPVGAVEDWGGIDSRR